MNIGRKVVILSISAGIQRFEETLTLLEENAAKDGDLLLLPEFCLGIDPVLSMDDEKIQKISAIAKKYSKYIVFPIYRKSERDKRLNTAIFFDRTGEIVGTYDKVYPFWEEFDLSPPAVPGSEAPVFQTDFGKIGFAICFDSNFPDLWKQLRLKGAELVLWSSAYSGGISLQAHAINYNYYIISSTYGPGTQISDCSVYDITGKELFYGQNKGVSVFRNEIDLDRCIFHKDFNIIKRDKLLQEHAGEIEMDCDCTKEGWFTLRAIKPGVSARALAKEYEMEELHEYKIRSEKEIDHIRGYRYQ